MTHSISHVVMQTHLAWSAEILFPLHTICFFLLIPHIFCPGRRRSRRCLYLFCPSIRLFRSPASWYWEAARDANCVLWPSCVTTLAIGEGVWKRQQALPKKMRRKEKKTFIRGNGISSRDGSSFFTRCHKSAQAIGALQNKRRLTNCLFIVLAKFLLGVW